MGYGGYSYEHAPPEIWDMVKQKRINAKKKSESRKRLSNKVRKIGNEVEVEKDLERRALELWFEIKKRDSKKTCENCGADLSHYNDWEWRGSQNHIVDKSKINGCPSVATNEYNHNVLGYWCCHPQWSTNFLNQSKMKCFPEAKRRFGLFKDLIPPQELRKVSPYLIATSKENDQKEAI
jgi:hypothetical protein